MLCTLKYAANLQERGTDMKKKLKQFKKYSSVTVMALCCTKKSGKGIDKSWFCLYWG